MAPCCSCRLLVKIFKRYSMNIQKVRSRRGITMSPRHLNLWTSRWPFHCGVVFQRHPRKCHISTSTGKANFITLKKWNKYNSTLHDCTGGGGVSWFIRQHHFCLPDAHRRDHRHRLNQLHGFLFNWVHRWHSCFGIFYQWLEMVEDRISYLKKLNAGSHNILGGGGGLIYPDVVKVVFKKSNLTGIPACLFYHSLWNTINF